MIKQVYKFDAHTSSAFACNPYKLQVMRGHVGLLAYICLVLLLVMTVPWILLETPVIPSVVGSTGVLLYMLSGLHTLLYGNPADTSRCRI